jgi:DNA damage-binding protein 1
MAHNYLVTAHPPTAVTACATGHFTSPSDLNLVLAKVNQVEILVVTPEGLRPVKQFTINGRVQVMKFFRPQGPRRISQTGYSS